MHILCVFYLTKTIQAGLFLDENITRVLFDKNHTHVLCVFFSYRDFIRVYLDKKIICFCGLRLPCFSSLPLLYYFLCHFLYLSACLCCLSLSRCFFCVSLFPDLLRRLCTDFLQVIFLMRDILDKSYIRYVIFYNSCNWEDDNKKC